jgi:putative colanic acid biosynthesis glycosyltransferase
MKVVQMNTVCGVGSTGRIAVGISKALEAAGHSSLIAYGRGNAPAQVQAICRATTLETQLHGLYTRVWDAHGFGSKQGTKKLIEAIERYDPDLVQLHNIHGYYLNIELLFDYLSEAQKPVVWTLHDCWAFTGHCSHFDYAGCSKWQTGCGACPQKNRYPASLLRDGSKENFARKQKLFTSVPNMTLVTPSRWLAGLASQSFLGRYPVQVIPNGIDLGVFQYTPGDFRRKNGLEGKKIALGVAGVWDDRKGYDTFCRLAGEADSTVQVVLVGLTQAQKDRLPANILGITHTQDVNELAGIYSAADVFVNPTLEDNFPTTNLEALACGTPVVTFATGGSVESIDETCGKIVPKGDLAALKQAVLEMDKTPERSAACRERAMGYDEKTRFAQYVSLYEGLTRV